jgi:hypothetical protein
MKPITDSTNSNDIMTTANGGVHKKGDNKRLKLSSGIDEETLNSGAEGYE